MGALSSLNINRFKTLMESGDNLGTDAIAKAITYYQSCMDIEALEMQTLPTLTSIIQDLGM